MSEMISFGAGVNSVAMTIMLVEQGWRGPIVFADTGGEHPETYCYLRYFGDWLKERGLEITRISPSTHPDLYHDKRIGGDGALSLEQYCLNRGIIPLVYQKWCSVMFKGDPLTWWRKEYGIDRALHGISADENPRRVHADDPAVGYPLVDNCISRGECARIIQRAGLDIPIKSGCFFCPNQGLAEWRRLYLDHPDLYERAIAMEDRASDNQQRWCTLKEDYSLRQMRERRWQGIVEMDLGDFMPCACRL